MRNVHRRGLHMRLTREYCLIWGFLAFQTLQSDWMHQIGSKTTLTWAHDTPIKLSNIRLWARRTWARTCLSNWINARIRPTAIFHVGKGTSKTWLRSKRLRSSTWHKKLNTARVNQKRAWHSIETNRTILFQEINQLHRFIIRVQWTAIKMKCKTNLNSSWTSWTGKATTICREKNHWSSSRIWHRYSSKSRLLGWA